MKRKIISKALLFIFLIAIISTATHKNDVAADAKGFYTAAQDRKKADTVTDTVNSISAEYAEICTATQKEINESRTRTVRINFMGDCMLASMKGNNYAGTFNNYAENKDAAYFFEKVQFYLNEADVNIANCENVFTDNPLKERYKGEGDRVFWFKSPSVNARIFKECNIDFVSIANNHIYDYGEKGKTDTIEALNAADVLYGADAEPVIIERNGISIAIICFTLWENKDDEVIQTLNQISESTDLQIIYFHGGTEKSHSINPYIQERCHRFADGGADLIIGAHPHVLQPMENYNGTDIVYSLGNFVYGGHTKPENETMIYTHIFTLNNNGNIILSEREILPCYVFTGDINNYQPSPITDNELAEEIRFKILPE